MWIAFLKYTNSKVTIKVQQKKTKSWISDYKILHSLYVNNNIC